MRATIDNLGKLEIPQQLREIAKLLPGAQVEVELSSGGGVHVRPLLAPTGGGTEHMEHAENGGPAPRLEREGSVLVVSGVTYDGPWENLLSAVREDHIARSAGIRGDEDAD